MMKAEDRVVAGSLATTNAIRNKDSRGAWWMCLHRFAVCG